MLETTGEYKTTPQNYPFHKTTTSAEDKGSGKCKHAVRVCAVNLPSVRQ